MVELSFEESILSASRPSDIFTMDASTLREQAEEYLSKLKPQSYKTVENFVLAQKVKKLFAEAQEELKLLEKSDAISTLMLRSVNGKTYEFRRVSSYSSKLGIMYDSENYVIFRVKPEYKAFYDNYVSKTMEYSVVDRKVWQIVKYMVPNLTESFEEIDGTLIVILKKPTKMYSLRELLEYFDGSMNPRYIASIMSRLYYFACYAGLADFSHNAITVDNLFFAPGRFVEEGKPYTVDDMRIVGVFGGWFFSTYSSEKICGMPKEVLQIVPAEVKRTGYSSYRVDVLAIKQVARVLSGDITGAHLENVPEPMRSFITKTDVEKNAYEEFHTWKKVQTETFGKDRFISMDISK